MTIACAHAPRADERDPASLTDDGLAALNANKLDEAVKDFDAALTRDPKLLAAIRGRIEAIRRLGKLPALIALLAAHVERVPADGIAWYGLGLGRFASGDEAGAVLALTRATARMPDESDAWYRLGIALFNGEKFAEARAPLERAVALNPRSARYRVPLASCLDRLGLHKEAIAQLAPIPDLAPTPEEAKLAMQTSRVLTEPFRGIPQESRAQLEQALGYLLRDAPGLATAPLEELIAKMPELGAAHALYGLAAERLDQAGLAVTELKRAAELSPEAPQPHIYLGEFYTAHGRAELAIQELQAALERDPLDVQTMRKLALLQVDQPNGLGPALKTLRRLVALVPDDDPAQLLFARTELLSPETAPSGLARLEKLAEKKPQDPEVLLRLALVLFDLRAKETGSEREGTTKRAVELTQRVLTLQPGNAAASKLLTALQSG